MSVQILNTKYKIQRGFTLIELMVVVSIIAILALIGLVSYNEVQKNGRDSKRKADVQAIAKALESNYNTNSSNPYPALVSSLFTSGAVPADPKTGTAIAVLAAVGLTLYSGTQAKARNSQRRADLDAIAKAFESKVVPEKEFYENTPLK